MTTTATDTPILRKTRELCQVIADSAEFRSMRENMDRFMADGAAQAQYQQVVEKSEALQHKQNNGEALSQAEIDDFETQREALVNNPVARGFLDARQQMHQVQDSVTKYVTKTFELGRIPNPEDFDSCGHGCSCGH